MIKPAGEGEGCGMKILYVEDNDDNIFMLKNRLTRAGYTVVVATDGAQGVAMAASERPVAGAEQAVRSRAARYHDAEGERVRGADPDEGGWRPSAHPRHHDFCGR